MMNEREIHICSLAFETIFDCACSVCNRCVIIQLPLGKFVAVRIHASVVFNALREGPCLTVSRMRMIIASICCHVLSVILTLGCIQRMGAAKLFSLLQLKCE
jgi:hypothetical protein